MKQTLGIGAGVLAALGIFAGMAGAAGSLASREAEQYRPKISKSSTEPQESSTELAETKQELATARVRAIAQSSKVRELRAEIRELERWNQAGAEELYRTKAELYRAESALRALPQCAEDEALLIGSGDFDNGRWSSYQCRHSDSFAAELLSSETAHAQLVELLCGSVGRHWSRAHGVLVLVESCEIQERRES